MDGSLRALVALLVLTLGAGCVGNTPTDRDPPAPAFLVDDQWAMRATVNSGIEDAHDHLDPAHHRNLTTPNFQIIGHDPLVTEYHGAVSGSYYCGEAKDAGERALAAFVSLYSDVALVVVDVTDRTQPQLVGELAMPLTMTYDAALTDDGRYAVIATSPNDRGPDDPPVPHHKRHLVWRDACGDEHRGPETQLPYGGGILLVDLQDPTEPTVVDFVPQPYFGAHSISATTIDGTRYVLASTTNVAQAASYYTVLTVDDTPAGGKLTPYVTIPAQAVDQEAPDPGTATNGHVEGSLQKHPITGQLLAYLAAWNGGVQIHELHGPGRAVPIGTWTGLPQLHEAIPLAELWNGRHITITGQELGGPPDGLPSGYLVLLDTTDPSAPQPLVYWTLPVEPFQWDGGLNYSPHYAVMVNETLFMANYHGGVWAIDAREEHWPAMPTKGVFIPSADRPTEPVIVATAPRVLDVNALPDGTLVVFDATTGVYTLRFDPNANVPTLPPYGPVPAFIG